MLCELHKKKYNKNITIIVRGKRYINKSISKGNTQNEQMIKREDT